MVMSCFNGSDLLHIFARLNKKIREELPEAGLLDQKKVLRVKQVVERTKLLQNIKYGLQLATHIDFAFDGSIPSEFCDFGMIRTLVFGAVV
jgi:hypothetical protein